MTADVRSSDILPDAFDAFRAGNGDNPRLLCQEPADGDTGRSRFFPAGQLLYIFYQRYIVLQVLRLERGMEERKSVLSNVVLRSKRPVSMAFPSGLNGTKPIPSSSNVGSSSFST